MKFYIMTSYSNAFKAMKTSKKTVQDIGYTFLVLHILDKFKEFPTPEAIEELVAEINTEPLYSELTRDLKYGNKPLTRKDVESACVYLFKPASRPKTAPPASEVGVAYDMPPGYKPLDTSTVLAAFEDIWRYTNETLVNGREAVNILSWTQTAPGGFQWSFCNQHGFVEELQEAKQYVRSGGTWEGMLNVLHKCKDDSDFQGDLMGYFERVKEKLPIRTDIKTQSGDPWHLGLTFGGLFSHLELNYKARAGLPSPPEKIVDPEVVQNALPDTRAMYNMLEDGADALFDNLLTFKSYLVTTRLANKNAVYKISALHEKTRAYHIYPMAMRILFSLYYQPMKDRLLPFDTEAKTQSESMLGFSWFHGGAQTLLDFISSVREEELCKFYYSDDSFYFCRRGNIVQMVSPDFSHFDGSIRQAHIDVNTAYDKWRFAAHGGSQRDANAAEFMNQLALVHKVIVTRTGTFLKTFGNSSGHGNTTGINQTVSALASCIAEDLWEEGKHTFDTFTTFVSRLGQRWLDRLGVVAKEGTMKVSVGRLDFGVGETLPISFLGQDLCKVESRGQEVVVPVPPLSNLVKSYVFAPGIFDKTQAVNAYDLRGARALGLCLTGGFYYPNFFDMLEKDFNTALKQRKLDVNATKTFSLDSVDSIYGEEFHQIDLEVLKKHDWSAGFASRDWFIQAFSANPRYDEKVNTPTVKTAVAGRAKLSDDDIRAAFKKKRSLTATIPPGSVLKSKEQSLKEEQERFNKRFSAAAGAAADKIIPSPPPKKPIGAATPKPSLTPHMSREERVNRKEKRVEKAVASRRNEDVQSSFQNQVTEAKYKIYNALETDDFDGSLDKAESRLGIKRKVLVVAFDQLLASGKVVRNIHCGHLGYRKAERAKEILEREKKNMAGTWQETHIQQELEHVEKALEFSQQEQKKAEREGVLRLPLPTDIKQHIIRTQELSPPSDPILSSDSQNHYYSDTSGKVGLKNNYIVFERESVALEEELQRLVNEPTAPPEKAVDQDLPYGVEFITAISGGMTDQASLIAKFKSKYAKAFAQAVKLGVKFSAKTKTFSLE